MSEQVDVRENGVSGYPEPMAEEAQQEPTLEIEISAQLALVRQMMQTVESQPLEVAEKFLCDALGLARAGKDELARRKFAAALNVLGGGKSD